MSEHDDVRRAMEELSSHPPQRDRKPGVHNRIAVVRRRRQFSSGLALSVATLLVGVTWTSVRVGNQPLKDDALASRSEQTTPSPVITPEPTAVAAADPLTGKAAPAKSKVPPVSPTKVVAGAPAGSKPAASSPPGVISPPPRVANPLPTAAVTPILPTQRTLPLPVVPSSVVPPQVLPSVSASVHATAAVTPSGATTPSPTASVSPTVTPGAADVLNAEITAATVADGSAAPETIVQVRVLGKIHGSLDNLTVWFTKIHRVNYAGSDVPACAVRDGQLHDIDQTFTFRTRYRAAGPEQIDATVTTVDKTCVRAEAPRQWAFSTAVTIPVGSTLSNGVRPVTLSLGTPQVTDARVNLSANAQDPDGYVSGFTVDWGAGAAASVYPGGNGANCSAAEAGGIFWPDGYGSGVFTSPTMAPGTYTVTVTAEATGCGGKDAQSAKQTVTVTVP